MAHVVVAHGAWTAGWSWRKMRSLLRGIGHDLWSPSYTGLGERAHLAHHGIDLETHVADLSAVLTVEDLADVVLVGHSYGGIVATVVADRLATRIRQVIYLDAFVPRDGQCLFDLVGEKAAANMRDQAARLGDGWRVPPNPLPPDTPPDDVAWMEPRRRMQPIRTFEQRATLRGDVASLRRSFVYCCRPGPGDVFRQFRDRAKEAGWDVRDIDASHSPQVTAPEALGAILQELIE